MAVNAAAHQRAGYGIEREPVSAQVDNGAIIEAAVASAKRRLDGMGSSERKTEVRPLQRRRGAILVLNLDHGAELPTLIANPRLKELGEEFGPIAPVFLPPDCNERAGTLRFYLASKDRPSRFLFPEDHGFNVDASFTEIIARRAGIAVDVIRVEFQQNNDTGK